MQYSYFKESSIKYEPDKAFDATEFARMMEHFHLVDFLESYEPENELKEGAEVDNTAMLVTLLAKVCAMSQLILELQNSVELLQKEVRYLRQT